MYQVGLITASMLYERAILDDHHELFINPRRASTARVTVVGLSVFVCLSLANLAVQGTGLPMTATNCFKVARSLIRIGRFS